MSPFYQSKLLIALILVLVLGAIVVLFSGRIFSSPATISGIIDYNGTTPEGATVAIATRKLGDQQYATVISGLSPTGGTKWSWAKAESGKAYDVQAYLQVNGKNVATSQAVTVAAPADGEVLVINSTHNPTEKKAKISGTVNMNGSVPAGSTIAIGEKSPAETEYTIVATDLAAVDGVKWSWGDAKEGSLYTIKAFLQLNGSNMYESDPLQVAAPASNEVLTLNARSTSPTPTPVGPTPVPAASAIQGTINLNGPSPSNSTIVIAARRTGTSQFNVVTSNVSSNNGAGWSWKTANAGTSYDLQAWVQVNSSTVLQSQILTVTSPASNEVLTINNASNQYGAPPSGSISSSCTGFNNSQWQVAFSYNNNSVVQNPQQYNLTAGSSSGGSQVFTTVTTPGNPGQQQSYTSGYLFNPNQTYYVQYAYSVCTNCNIWSAFSQPLAFTCGGAPAPTATPTPTGAPTPTPTATPTITPTPTLPPNISACNQTCGSNGYSCAVGLQCVSGDLPGSQVCRNPNCTSSSSCVCNLLQN